MTVWMLDTNAVSNLIRDRLTKAPPLKSPPDDICISAISEAEVLFGVRRRPEARSLNALILGFIDGIAVLPFDREVAQRYGSLRADMQRMGKSLTELDMLIAAHALSIGATLVTSDTAFRQVPGLAVEDWA
jgi:tRNA(fMet)-specific endonuclease VapC